MYILLMLVLILNIVSLSLVAKSVNQHTSEISDIKTNTQAVESNQRTNSNAIKDYIACLLIISPTLNRTQALQQANVCFNAAPPVK